MDDKKLEIEIALKSTGQDAAKGSAEAVKQAADETKRFEETLRQLAERQAGAGQDKIWADLAARAREYAPAINAELAAQQKLVEAFQEWKSTQNETNAGAQLQRFNEELDEAQAAAADFAGNLQAVVSAYGAAATAAQNYADQLGQVVTRNQNINTTLVEQLSLYQAIERVQAAQTSAEKTRKIASVHADEANHNSAPGQTHTQAGKDAATNAKTKAGENTNTIEELKRQVAALPQTISAQRPREHAAVTAQRDAAQSQDTTRIAGDFERNARTLGEFNRSKNPTAELLARANAAMVEIIQLIHGHTDILSQLPDFKEQLAALKSEQERINAQLRAQSGNASR
jgi:hypothetical protein